jgi:hypothetical protein
MPLGDADIASGVFFSDFAVPVVFGEQAARGNFDAPGKDSIFGDTTSVSNNEYRVEMAATAFSPFPEVDDVLTVNGQRYKIRAISPLDDGATVEVKLKRLN